MCFHNLGCQRQSVPSLTAFIEPKNRKEESKILPCSQTFQFSIMTTLFNLALERHGHSHLVQAERDVPRNIRIGHRDLENLNLSTAFARSGSAMHISSCHPLRIIQKRTPGHMTAIDSRGGFGPLSLQGIAVVVRMEYDFKRNIFYVLNAAL